MDAIIGKTFIRGKDPVDLENVIAKDFVLIYFGAHWAPPCRLFTPSLVDFYKKINDSSAEKKIEVVFASIDGNLAAFERNFAEMPWTAIPFSDDTRIQNLK
jgi:nucleoredoxin